MHPLLRNAIILDTETLGLRRGAGVHEAAIYDFRTKTVHEYILDPNAVRVLPATPQDRVGFSSTMADRFERLQVHSWQAAVAAEIFEEHGIQVPEHEAFARLRDYNVFLAEKLKGGAYPHLLGHKDDIAARTAALNARGIVANLGNLTTIDDLLKIQLPAHMKDAEILWIANAAFESKQLGAQLAVTPGASLSLGLETYNPNSVDPFYVTGKNVNAARNVAARTGDWRPVWGAYKQPHAGLAVRDILDLTRSALSYGRSLGLYKGPTVGLSVDAQTKLWDQILNLNIGQESHRAAEDAAVHESSLVERLLNLNEALQAADERTPEGLRLMAAARQKQGVLAQAANAFATLQANQPAFQTQNAAKRLARAREDLMRKGVSIQSTDVYENYDQMHLGPDGEAINMRRQLARKKSYDTLEGVVGHMRGDYPDIDIEPLAREVQGLKTIPEIAAFEAKHLVTKLASRRGVLRQAPVPRNLLGIGLAAGVAAFAVGTMAERPGEHYGNILDFNYQQWREGMAPTGIAKEQRHINTDFGSPYRGPAVSNQVLIDQEYIAEREKYMRAQYGATHYDPIKGLFGISSVFKWARPHYNYLAGDPYTGDLASIRGKNLREINIDDGWKLNAPDADTVVLQRGGVRGAIGSFFGLNREYVFRLAGVDAPETSHGRAAQPGADDAATAFQQLVAGRGGRLVFDPSQTTYGRAMAALVVNGKNINFEAVRRGYAAHLPFGKHENSIIDYQALGVQERLAYQGNRGIWGESWTRVFYEAAASRPTFNTLANPSKVAESGGLMAMVSLMNASVGKPWTEQLAAQAQMARTQGMDDEVRPYVFEHAHSVGSNVLIEQLRDVSTLMRTHGNKNPNVLQVDKFRKLNATMALDTLGTTNDVHAKRRLQAFETYETHKAIRRERQMQAQRFQVEQQFASPINHQRM